MGNITPIFLPPSKRSSQIGDAQRSSSSPPPLLLLLFLSRAGSLKSTTTMKSVLCMVLGCVLGSPRWRGGYGEEDLLSDDRVLPASGATHGPTGGSKRNVPCPRVQEAVWRL